MPHMGINLVLCRMEPVNKAGFDEDAVKRIVKQTLYGAAALLNGSKDMPMDLVKKVASKGGTTEAALSVFAEKDLKSIIEDAVLKAKKRSEELSGE